jgi:hypothetical protein
MLISRKLLAPLALLSLVQCSSPRIGPYTQKEVDENIYFHYFRKLEDKKLRAKIAKSPYALMRSTYPEFVIAVGRAPAAKALLAELPRGLIHGDFHPLQMSWRNGEAYLDDWDTVTTGELWQDIVRQDAAAKILASSEGLRGYPDSVCLDAYAKVFVSGKSSGKGQALAPSTKQGESIEDFSKHPVWEKAEDEKEIPKELLAALREWIPSQTNLPIKNTDPMKRLVSGVGSLLKQKILVLDESKRLWEMKEVDARADGCASYAKLAASFAKLATLSLPATPAPSNPVHACWQWKDRTFTLLKWDARYWSPDAEDFKSAPALVEHVTWACEKLADFHRTSLDAKQSREWALALKGSAPLKSRLKEITTAVFKSYQDGYRMILADQE